MKRSSGPVMRKILIYRLSCGSMNAIDADDWINKELMTYPKRAETNTDDFITSEKKPI